MLLSRPPQNAPKPIEPKSSSASSILLELPQYPLPVFMPPVPVKPFSSPAAIPDIDLVKTLTLSEGLRFLETPWIVPSGFQWPFTERKKDGPMRKK
jgi:hypothetical protein